MSIRARDLLNEVLDVVAGDKEEAVTTDGLGVVEDAVETATLMITVDLLPMKEGSQEDDRVVVCLLLIEVAVEHHGEDDLLMAGLLPLDLVVEGRGEDNAQAMALNSSWATVRKIMTQNLTPDPKVAFTSLQAMVGMGIHHGFHDMVGLGIEDRLNDGLEDTKLILILILKVMSRMSPGSELSDQNIHARWDHQDSRHG